MITATGPAALAASIVAVLTSLGFLATLLRHRHDPTTGPVLGIAVTLLAGAVLHLAVVDIAPIRHALGIQWAPTDSPGGFWTLIAFDIPAIVGVLWFLFALQYTGRDRNATPIALSAVAVLLVLLIAPNVALAMVGAFIGVSTTTLNTVLGITIVLADSLAVIGIFLLCATTLRHKAFPATQTALLTFAVTTILTLPFVTATLQEPIATPLAITASALLFTTVVHHYRVFETLPVVSIAGRDRVINDMADGVILTDTDGRIRDLNPAAESLFDSSRTDVLGASLNTIAATLPAPNQIPEADPQTIRGNSGRIVSVTAESVSHTRGRTLGYLLVCRDITETRRREHRLSVLTQLVADATTNEMRTVTTIADAIAAGDHPAPDGGARILETATDTATLVGRVRSVERALADRNPAQSTQTTVQALVDDLQSTLPVDVSTPAAGTPLQVAADRQLVVTLLETLVTAAETTDTMVSLHANTEADRVTITVTPYPQRDTDTIADCALEIAQLAATHTDWTVETTTSDNDPAVCVQLPAHPADTDKDTEPNTR
ncbi:PAS domain-containing protein [Salarchaeum japonicum]|uniref:PAS domain-containing protein n=1 Tax=Salarchaeum japonicum TaxID=555573 RepID=UPI003C774298